tara:strand:- start:292 stop:492 length:201 start_codon:yes stop_codon:yes gene_type:complete
MRKKIDRRADRRNKIIKAKTDIKSKEKASFNKAKDMQKSDLAVTRKEGKEQFYRTIGKKKLIKTRK